MTVITITQVGHVWVAWVDGVTMGRGTTAHEAARQALRNDRASRRWCQTRFPPIRVRLRAAADERSRCPVHGSGRQGRCNYCEESGD